VGSIVGNSEGEVDGRPLGNPLGAALGDSVGRSVGMSVGNGTVPLKLASCKILLWRSRSHLLDILLLASTSGRSSLPPSSAETKLTINSAEIRSTLIPKNSL